jgi:phosphoglycerate dehydrogenase-like enzyme
MLILKLMDQFKGIILVSLAPAHIPPDMTERLREAGGGREVRTALRKADIEPFLDSIEIAMGDVHFSLIPRMPRLAWVQLWSAGADRLQKYPALKELPFLLTSTSGMHGRQMTEHLFALALAWNRRLDEAFAARTRREWLKIPRERLPLWAGKTMLILGYGAIGREIARAALAFGMKVIGLRRHVSADPEGDIRIEEASKLTRLLPQADLVVNLLPFTRDTRDSFGGTEFAAMKKTALYANLGRGNTTDEGAMIEALKTGKIAGALLDVSAQEPLPADSPLWGMNNVLITGHYGGLAEDYNVRAAEIALENLRRYLRGGVLKNLVDKQRGY